jgi:FkbM family methyltransferase
MRTPIYGGHSHVSAYPAQRPGKPGTPEWAGEVDLAVAMEVPRLRPSRAAELTLKTMLQHSKRSLGDRLIRALLGGIRRILAQRRDILVRYNLDGTELLLPFSHELPFYRRGFPEYSENVGRLAFHVDRKYPGFRFIDVGANIGDTAAIVRSSSQCPMLCIEGDDYYFKILEHNLRKASFADVMTAHAFIGSHSGAVSAKVVSRWGTAHLEESGTQLEVTRLTDLLQKYPNFMQAKMLKIDTDGFDCTIVRAELEFLSRARPVLFLEYDPFLFRNQPYDGYSLFGDLQSAGYEYGVFYDNTGDYLVSAHLGENRSVVADVQAYYSGRGGSEYADVCVFHHEDRDLGHQIRDFELDHFRKVRHN